MHRYIVTHTWLHHDPAIGLTTCVVPCYGLAAASGLVKFAVTTHLPSASANVAVANMRSLIRGANGAKEWRYVGDDNRWIVKVEKYPYPRKSKKKDPSA